MNNETKSGACSGLPNIDPWLHFMCFSFLPVYH